MQRDSSEAATPVRATSLIVSPFTTLQGDVSLGIGLLNVSPRDSPDSSSFRLARREGVTRSARHSRAPRGRSARAVSCRPWSSGRKTRRLACSMWSDGSLCTQTYCSASRMSLRSAWWRARIFASPPLNRIACGAGTRGTLQRTAVPCAAEPRWSKHCRWHTGSHTGVRGRAASAIPVRARARRARRLRARTVLAICAARRRRALGKRAESESRAVLTSIRIAEDTARAAVARKASSTGRRRRPRAGARSC